jgi:hypothetical protein
VRAERAARRTTQAIGKSAGSRTLATFAARRAAGRGLKARTFLAFVATTAATIALVLFSATAIADTDAEAEPNAALFTEGIAAMNRGAWDDAIDRFELLADRGFSNANVTYDRGIAYVKRAESHGARPGDLGRAAAALAETLLLEPNDADAAFALERVHQEIARRRARSHASQVDQRPSLGWAVVGLLDEDTWALLAAIGSVALSLGLAVRFAARAAALALGAVVVASLGAALLAVTGSLAALSRYDRVHVHPAVVIVEEARLLDDNGAGITGPGSVVPEGAMVRVVDERGNLARVEWGTLDGWLSLGQLRLLTRP